MFKNNVLCDETMSILYVAMTDLPAALACEMASHAPLPRLPLLERMLGCSQVQDAPLDWRRWVLSLAGLKGDAGDLPLGRLLGAAAGHALDPMATWCIATPVSLRSGLSSVHFDNQGPVALSPEARASLAARYSGASSASAHTLYSTPDTLLMRFNSRLDVQTHDPESLAGLSLGEALPAGQDRRVLQRVGTEIEMWLHAEPDFKAPRAVSSLWLWGSGNTDLYGKPHWPQLSLADPSLRAARAQYPGEEVAEGTIDRWSVNALLAEGQPLPELESRWLTPIVAGLGQQWREVHLHVCGRVFRIKRARDWRWWRAARPWWEQLAEVAR